MDNNILERLSGVLENLTNFSFVGEEESIRYLPDYYDELRKYKHKIQGHKEIISTLFLEGKNDVINRVRKRLEQKKSELQELLKDVTSCENTTAELQYDDVHDCAFAVEPKRLKDLIEIRLCYVTDFSEHINNLYDTSKPQQLIIPDNILKLLQEHGFIENAAARPLKWIKTISTTHGQIPNKKSLLDLLCLLGYSHDVIKNRTLLNSLFIFSNNKPLTAQNYTYITDTKGNIKSPIISQYHNELEKIVNQSKED